MKWKVTVPLVVPVQAESTSDSRCSASDRAVAELNYFCGVAVYLSSRTLTNKS